jgi:uncharacterized protein (UPF0333 family)
VNTILEFALLAAVVIVIAGIAACWQAAHDGSMTGKAELAEDIAQDLMDEPEEAA